LATELEFPDLTDTEKQCFLKAVKDMGDLWVQGRGQSGANGQHSDPSNEETSSIIPDPTSSTTATAVNPHQSPDGLTHSS
jgi:hypothetical protein